VNVTDKLNQLL